MADRELKIDFEELPLSVTERIDLDTGKIQDYISEEWVVSLGLTEIGPPPSLLGTSLINLKIVLCKVLLYPIENRAFII